MNKPTNKPETIEKVKSILGVEPDAEERGGCTFFTVHGRYICHVSGTNEYATLGYPHGSVNPKYADWDRVARNLTAARDAAEKIANMNVPEGDFELTMFEYSPGGKWECGELNLDADTPLGKLEWREVIPGPRHGEDSAELVVTLNDKKIDIYEHHMELDFEAPGKPGRWAEQFADSDEEVAGMLEAWFEGNKQQLAYLLQSD